VTGADLPALDPVEEWLDRRDVTVRLPVPVYERLCAAAARDGHGGDLAAWLRELAEGQATLARQSSVKDRAAGD
jgi:hypothetical protein